MADSGSQNWVDDEHAEHCSSCGVAWSFFNRRHHCRSCGRVFCDKCSKGRCNVDGYEGAQRVCDACYNRLSKKAEWEGPAANMMKGGAEIREYYRVFSPAKLTISLSASGQTFTIKDASSGKVKGTFDVSDIESIQPGCSTKILETNKADPSCAVCITAKGKPWNIAFTTQKLQKAWVRGLTTRLEFEKMESSDDLYQKEQTKIAERQMAKERNAKRNQRNKMREKYKLKGK